MSSSTRALILAAGCGRRMLEATADRPKCLVQLAGRPLLDWQLAAIRQAGIEDIAAVGGYRAEQLVDRVRTPFVNQAWAATNMVRSLMCAADWLHAGNTVIVYSDIAFRASAVHRLAEATSDISITFDRQWDRLWSGRFGSPLDDAETFRCENGRVVEIGGRPTSVAEVQGQFMGLLRFTAAGWRRISRYLDGLEAPVIDKLDMTGLLSRLIQAGEHVQGVAVDGGWVEVDSASDLAYYEEMLCRLGPSGGWTHDWR